MKAFVTGGAGYLGRALLAAEEDPAFTVFSRDEHKQWKLKEKYRNSRFVLGDVRDFLRVQTTMPYQVPVVIHAAAQKFVPEGESDAIEFARTNVEGTINVGLAAGLNHAEVAVFISTDKALSPVNNYGNVIGSTGSVVELFRKQLATTGTVTVTSEDCSRFWMTAQEAVDAIWWAVGDALRGTITVPLSALRQGSIRNLLAAMNVPNDKRNHIGLRPGEKMHETIIGAHEIARTHLMPHGYAIIKRSIATPIPEHQLDFRMQPHEDSQRFSEFVEHGRQITSHDVRNCSDAEFQELLRNVE